MAIQFKNRVVIKGELVDVDLQEYNGTSKTTQEPYKAITGNYTLRVVGKDDTEQMINLRTFTMEKFNSGKDNSSYKYLANWMADFANNDGANYKGKMYKVSTSISENSFISPSTGEPVMATQIQGGFIDDRNVGRPSADFEVDMLLEAEPIPETKDDEETGRYFVNGTIFDFRNMAYPARFVLDQQNAYDYFVSLDASKNNPVLISVWGNVINNTISTTRTIESAFGDPRVEVMETSRRENIITGADVEPKEITEEIFQEIKKGMDAHKIHIDSLVEKNAAPKASGFGAPAGDKPASKPQAKTFQF